MNSVIFRFIILNNPRSVTAAVIPQPYSFYLYSQFCTQTLVKCGESVLKSLFVHFNKRGVLHQRQKEVRSSGLSVIMYFYTGLN